MFCGLFAIVIPLYIGRACDNFVADPSSIGCQYSGVAVSLTFAVSVVICIVLYLFLLHFPSRYVVEDENTSTNEVGGEVVEEIDMVQSDLKVRLGAI